MRILIITYIALFLASCGSESTPPNPPTPWELDAGEVTYPELPPIVVDPPTYDAGIDASFP